MYTGKEVCQGCKRPATEESRSVKIDLCRDCKKSLKIGKCSEVESKIPYTSIRQWYHALSNLDFNDSSINSGLISTLKALDNKYASGGNLRNITGKHADNAIYVTIPTDIVEPLEIMFNKLNTFVREMREEKGEMPRMASRAVSDLKNEIYNAGVEKGRDLLGSLNAGEITVGEFDEFIKKY